MSATGVWSNSNYVAWIYRHLFPTRGRAQQHFLRALRNAGWDSIDWTRVRTRVRFIRPDSQRYVECGELEPGAIAVWRCELAPARDY